jgi:putative redox protein
MNFQINFDCLRSQRVPFHSEGVVVAETGNNRHQQLILAGRHALLADRSTLEGGGDTGPDPQSLLMMALGSQISMALRASADRNGWMLEQIVVHFDDPSCDRDDRRSLHNRRDERRITCSIELIGDLYDWQQSQLVAVANRYLAAWNSLVTMQPTVRFADRAA